MGYMMNQKVNAETGVMEHVRLYNKCSHCLVNKAIISFPTIYKKGNIINERQQIYTLWRTIFDTQTTIKANASVSIDTVVN